MGTEQETMDSFITGIYGTQSVFLVSVFLLADTVVPREASSLFTHPVFREGIGAVKAFNKSSTPIHGKHCQETQV